MGFVDLTTAQTVVGAKTFSGATVLGGTLTLSNFTQKSIPFIGASGLISQNNANLNWDDVSTLLTIGSSGSGASAKLAINGSLQIFGSGTGITFNDGTSLTSVNGVGSAASVSSTGNALIFADNDNLSGGDIIFKTALTDKAIITNSGNFGIGVPVPANPLTIGKASAGNVFVVRNTTDANDTFIITDTGSITAGSWNAGSISVAGANTFTVGTGATALGGTLTISQFTTAGILKTSATGLVSAGSVDLANSSNVTGVLSILNGGIGVATLTDGGVLIGNAGGVVQSTAVGAVGQVLMANAVGVDPTFQSLPANTAIQSLNGLTGVTQTFANGTTGTTPVFVSNNTIHTLNIPLAGTGVTSGTISNSAQTIIGDKTITVMGGSINNTPIGATTASTGAFTTLVATTSFATPLITSSAAGVITLQTVASVGSDDIIFSPVGIEKLRILESGGDLFFEKGTFDTTLSITVPASAHHSFIIPDTNTTSDTFAFLGATQTFSNKTLNGSTTILSPKIEGSVNPGTGLTFSTFGLTTSITGVGSWLAGSIGNGTAVVEVNSSDWDISTTGAMTGIGAITADGLITGTGGLSITNNATIGGEFRLLELSANGTNYVGFKSPDALAANIIYVMPTTDPTAGQVLSSTIPTAGVATLSWAAAGGSVKLNQILAADATNIPIDNLNFAQTWNWSTASTQTPLTINANAITSGGILSLASSSTALTGDLAKIELTGSGAGNTGNVLKLGVTGTTGTAIPLNINNAGIGSSFRVNDDGTYNDATPFIIDPSGNIGIGTATLTYATLTVDGGIGAFSGSNVVDSRVNNGLDDAEEIISTTAVNTGSSELDLGRDASSNQQLVGMRFNSISVPQGATITNAYVEFKAYTSAGGTAAVTLNIQGEDNDNALTFSSVNNNISARVRTTASVSWSIPAGGWPVSSLQQTANIKSIIEEIVGRIGWVSGQSIVIIINDGIDRRRAFPFEGGSPTAPLLHIEYTDAAGSSNVGTALSVTTAKTGSSALALRVNDDGTQTDTTPFVVDADSGNVGIGLAAPLYKLHVKEDTTGINDIAKFENSASSTACTLSSTTGVLSCTSDANLKRDILEMSSVNSLNSVLDLKPSSFLWNFDSGSNIQHGFIAQDVEKVIPNLVRIDSDTGYRSLSTIGMTPYLVGAIQELNKGLLDMDGFASLISEEIIVKAETTEIAKDEIVSISKDSFAKKFFNNLGKKLVAWFADSKNGITDFFANRVHTKELCIGDKENNDIGETCITKAQLDTLLINQNNQNNNVTPPIITTPSTNTTDTTNMTPSEVLAPINSPTPTLPEGEGVDTSIEPAIIEPSTTESTIIEPTTTEPTTPIVIHGEQTSQGGFITGEITIGDIVADIEPVQAP